MNKTIARNKSLLAGGLIISLIILVAVFAPFIAPHSPLDGNLRQSLSAPSKTFLLGTDRQGRDILSRIIFGSRIALLIGLLTQAVNSVIGTILGVMAGFLRGKTDDLIMGVVNVILSFPLMILALTLMVLLGPSLWNIIIALGLVNWAFTCRVARAETLSVSEKEFITAATAIGVSKARIMFRHILPQVAGPVLVVATLGAGNAILIAAGLSFLGVGVQPPKPSWGLMINQGLAYIRTAPWISLFPGLAISILTIGLNLLGDGMRDVLDVKSRAHMNLKKED